MDTPQVDLSSVPVQTIPVVSQEVQPQPPLPPITSSPPPGKDNMSLITVLLLLFVYPIGVIVMWARSGWKKWVKFLISLPLFLAIIGFLIIFIGGGAFFLTHPGKVTVSNKIASESGIPGASNIASESGNTRSSCFLDSDCASNICVTSGSKRICTDGKIGDICFLQSDCQSNICVDKICSSGVVGEKCVFSFDCQDGLSCTSGKCQSKSSINSQISPPSSLLTLSPTPTIFGQQQETSPSSQLKEGITGSLDSSGIPNFIIVGTFFALNPSQNSLTILTVDQNKSPLTITVLFENTIPFISKSGQMIKPTVFMQGDVVKIVSNSKTASNYQAKTVQNFSR